jgi:5'-nucleotidase
MSQSITSTRPLSWRRTLITRFEAYRVNGTPSACVALGVYNWGARRPGALGHQSGDESGQCDLALGHAGRGEAGGAAGGARDRRQHAGHGSGAEGVEIRNPQALDEAGHRGGAGSARSPLGECHLPSRPAGLCWTSQSFLHYDGKIVPGIDPMGRHHFWYTVVPIETVEEGTDRWAMNRQMVSLTPLRLDLTARNG